MMQRPLAAGLAGAALIAACLAAPAEARTRAATTAFDGSWSIEVITERGICDRAYRYGVVIDRGSVRYAGGTDFAVTGRVAAGGGVRGAIVRGSDRADFAGRLRGGGGSGTWNTAGLRVCGGRWNAERRG